MVHGTKGISAHGLDVYGDIKTTVFWVFLRGMCFAVHGLRARWQVTHHFLDHWRSRGGGLASRIRICMYNRNNWRMSDVVLAGAEGTAAR